MPMYYRRGFQRIYAVLTVVWVAGVLFAVLSGRWEPWYSPLLNGGWSSTEQLSPIRPPDFAKFMMEETRRRWLWATMLSITAPALGYGLLFYIGPWLYRGFRPRA